MAIILKRFRSDNKGQVLPMVLAILAIGGLTIAGSLNYAVTSLNGSRILAEDIKGIYAAGAGVENAIWSIDHGTFPPPALLPDKINGMAVSVQAESNGVYTLYLGELVQPGVHFEYLEVVEEITWDAEHGASGAYKFTITVTLIHEETIHISAIGARLPDDYGYEEGSALDFPDNLSCEPPDITTDSRGGCLVNWQFDLPYPQISKSKPTRTQSFYLTGEGPQEHEYTWVVANQTDVGVVGSITGARYKITSTATRTETDRIAAKIAADVMIEDTGTMYIVSWQISS